MDKKYLAEIGLKLAQQFCDKNKINQPTYNIIQEADDPLCKKIKAVGTCGYYRNNVINVGVPLCAHNNSNYSWPGFISDRTPYGVIAHELGHHIDQVMTGIDIYRNNHGFFFSDQIWKNSYEKAITSYAPNKSEWFAEMFRLFVTNPSLLQTIRPLTYSALRQHFEPVIAVDAYDVLKMFQATDRVYERMNKWISTKK